MSDQEQQEEKGPTHAEVMAEVERHNAEIKASKETTTRSAQVGNTKVSDVSYSDQTGQIVSDMFLEQSLAAARKNEQLIRVKGVPKKFLYHALYQSEKLELAKIEERRANSIVNMAEFIMRKRQGQQVESFSDVDFEYKYAMAHLFLIDPQTGEGMTKDDFSLTEPEQLNPILEGYGIRTEKPIPPPLGKKA